MVQSTVVILVAMDECGSDLTNEEGCWIPSRSGIIFLQYSSSLSPAETSPICQLLNGQSHRSRDIERHQLFPLTFSPRSQRYPSLPNWPGESTIKLLTRRAANLFIWEDTRPFRRQREISSRRTVGYFGGEADVVSGLNR
jgi:hypothetical protein